jgi:Ca2+-binding RTX toxin-like protein
MDRNGAAFPLVPVTFTGMGKGSQLVFNQFGQQGGADAFVFNGSAGGDAVLVSDAGPGGVAIGNTLNGVPHANLQVDNVASAVVQTLGGADTVTVAGAVTVPLTVDGGDPAAGDTLVFNATAAATLDLTARTVTQTGGGAVGFAGVEAVTLNGGGAAVTVAGTAGDDVFAVTPTGAGAGTFTASAAAGVAFAYTGAATITFDGGPGGFDTLAVFGTAAADTVTSAAAAVTVNGGTVGAGAGLDRLDVATAGGNDVVNLSGFTALPTRVDAGDGDDTITGSPQADDLFGGAGNDTILGGAGVDVLAGGDGNDALDGDAGADQGFGGGGSDTFTWNPGDGSDLVEGGDGSGDRLVFNGSAAAEGFSLAAAGDRFRLLRDVGSITMDVGGVELVTLNALAGADAATADDLSGTGVRSVAIDLGGADGAADAVTLNGTPGADQVDVTAAPGGAGVAGLAAAVTLTGAEAADRLTVAGLGGDDALTAEGATGIGLTLDGGAGNDTLLGSAGDDALAGGDGDDLFAGNGGTDAVAGGAGNDTILARGTAGADAIAVGPAGANLLVADAGGATTYTDAAAAGVELIRVDAGAGADAIDLTPVGVGLSVDGGAGADTVTARGRAGLGDAFQVSAGTDAASGRVTLTGGPGLSAEFAAVEGLVLDGGGGAGADSLALTGTGGSDAFTVLAAAGQPAGTATVNVGPAITFQNFGSAGSSLALSGLGGDDSFGFVQAANWGIGTVNVDGGPPSFSDSVSVTGTAGDDRFTFTPSTGTLVVAPAGGGATTYNLTDVESAGIDGLGHAAGDALVIPEPNPFCVTDPGPVPGRIDLAFENTESVRVNDLPAAAADAAAATEDAALDVAVLANDTGTGDGPLTVTITSAPLHGTAVVVGNVVRYTPAPNYSGPDSFSYRVEDANCEASTAVVTLTVNPVDDDPRANPDAYAATRNLTLTVPTPGVLGNDTDVEAGPLTAVLVSGPARGTLTLAADGSFVYVPAPNFVGTDTFVYRADDGTGGPQATVTITVGAPGNDVVAAGTDQGRPAEVRLFEAKTGGPLSALRPFDEFTGGVRVASADVNKDGTPDVILGTGPGRPTQVRVLDGKTGAVLFDTQPFEATFTGGVFVAAGDVNADGFADVVITPDEGGGPRARVFSGQDFGQLVDFFGIKDLSFRGGARAAVGDVDGDGFGDVIVAAGFQGGPRVSVWNGAQLVIGFEKTLFGDFFAFEETLRNGVFVAAGDLDGDGFAEVIAGGGPTGGPRVTAFSGKALLANQYEVRANFFGGDPDNRSGIRVAVKDMDGDARADLVVGPGTGSRVTGYLGKDVAPAGTPPAAFDFDAFPGFAGGVFVG